jgi:polysaccharide export outer membrane protein
MSAQCTRAARLAEFDIVASLRARWSGERVTVALSLDVNPIPVRRTLMRAVQLGWLLVTVLAAGACSTVGDKTTPRVVAAEEEYRIVAEDALQIVVWKNEALSRSVVVRPDGKISLPLLNDVQAAGMTANELKASLEKKFTEYIPAPEVYVVLTAIRGFDVNILGEGAKQGRYTLKKPTTVVELIALSGGFAQFASKSRITILRKEGSETKRIPFDYNKVIRGDAPDVVLRPDDIVVVP